MASVAITSKTVFALLLFHGLLLHVCGRCLCYCCFMVYCCMFVGDGCVTVVSWFIVACLWAMVVLLLIHGLLLNACGRWLCYC